MTVIDDLLSDVAPDAPTGPPEELAVGLYWTAVVGRHMGLAATPTDITCCFAEDVDDVGCLHEWPVSRLAHLLRSAHPLAVTIGMAALNSQIPVDPADGVEWNARDVLLERGRGKTVVTVGHFPFTDALREVAARLHVLELHPTPGDQPAEAAPDFVPQADVIGLTASTLLNGTFETLSKLFPPEALVVMLGPSTPLSRVLFDYGVNILGGALVTDPATALRYVTQGSSLHGVPGLRRFTMVRQ
jgi:hypothetical protein